MSAYNLNRILSPRSVALIGLGKDSRSVGRSVLTNLLGASFDGPIHLVDLSKSPIEGFRPLGKVADIPTDVDLAILATPPQTVPALINQIGAKGIAGVVILTAGLGHGPGSLADLTEQAARQHRLRIIGPNCLGVLNPRAKLNASFARRMPAAGNLALISQSGAIVASMIEWAAHRNIGFSSLISLGNQLDVDFGDLLDFFATDRETRAILLYIESISDGRKFMSAARAATRVKPVVVVKAGRHETGARAAKTHTGALTGSDAVYQAAFHRAGMLRVLTLDELFDAAETLARAQPISGSRLAVLTNGGGIGTLAVDYLADRGGKLASLSPETVRRLDACLPAIWSRENPVDIIGDADELRYANALEALLDDKNVDAILVMNVPTKSVLPLTAAREIARRATVSGLNTYGQKAVLALWVGDDPEVASVFSKAGIPHYSTEQDAIEGFMHLVSFSEAQRRLTKTPLETAGEPDTAAVKEIIESAIKRGVEWLEPVEVASVFAAYGLPFVPSKMAVNAEAAVAAAADFFKQGERVAIKVQSRDIVHKSDVGGVVLGLASAEAVRSAAAEILDRVRRARPSARIEGFLVQPVISRNNARELIAGISDDPTFGPVVLFGQGGVTVEVVNDTAIALPPLDNEIALDLIGRTKVSRLLKQYRNVPAANLAAIADALVRLSWLATDIPEIRQIDINPLLADEKGAIGIDGRILVKPSISSHGMGHPRMAIMPYPKHLECEIKYGDGNSAFIRPVKPQDEPLYIEFFEHVTDEDLRLRFFAPVKQSDHVFISRLTQIDYRRNMALIAIDPATKKMLGVVRMNSDANYIVGEYSILLRADIKGKGLGWALMQKIIAYARSEGLKRLEGQILPENSTMLRMCQELGFTLDRDKEDPSVHKAWLVL